MAVYWMTEIIPLPITSFIPVFVFPVTGVMSTAETVTCYFNESVFMFIGSLMLAAAVEQSGLHKRLALYAIQLIGYSHYKLLFAMCFVTMFISLWITNTAATTMMVPIIFALLKVFEDQNLLTIYDTTDDGSKVASSMTTCYFCAATFSATIGGIGTLVGTVTNLAFKGLLEKYYPDAPDYLSFPKYSAFALPYTFCMEIALYVCLILMSFGFLRPKSEAAKRAKISPEGILAAKMAVQEDVKNLGKITYWEINVILLFGTCMIMFFCRSPQIFPGWADRIIKYFNIKDLKFIKDSACAMFFCFLMLLLPSSMGIFDNFTKPVDDLPTQKQGSVLNFTPMDAVLPYSFSFLLGGGFALSTAAKKEYSDLNGKIGEALIGLQNFPNNLIILIIIIITVIITNFASNVAVCNVLVPIAMTLAQKIKAHPLLYCVTAGVSASFCFLLPVGTPGNLIVQSAANIPTSKMIVTGAAPTVVIIFITWFFLIVYAPVIWSDINAKEIPDWAKPKP
ncbi:protein I'm not dead yet-like isoform X2 [Hyposmocoma kahamanoa]|nr:protein I'm not dead yet-like isoform X2 [Hyposmocoma kahamanoa]